MTSSLNMAAVELTAVVVAVTEEQPRVLTLNDGCSLPSGPFESGHRSLQLGLRAWVEHQTHHPLGYVEQLYTFADRDRMTEGNDDRVISISYLGLTREAPVSEGPAAWADWYRFFPWEDRRDGPPPMLAASILPALEDWAAGSGDAETARIRRQRIAVTFGSADERRWNEELILQRYELLYEAGLVAEAAQRRPVAADRIIPGRAMALDHRRILATAIARLRAKIKYRPVVFELMPPAFTLLQLQRGVEALSGRRVHKQNFRRLIDQQGLVEDTGEVSTDTGGRPARLVRFRREVVAERAAVGTKLPLARPA